MRTRGLWKLENNRRQDETIYASHSQTLLYYREGWRRDSVFVVHGSAIRGYDRMQLRSYRK
jgi:hypothetical protein